MQGPCSCDEPGVFAEFSREFNQPGESRVRDAWQEERAEKWAGPSYVGRLGQEVWILS